MGFFERTWHRGRRPIGRAIRIGCVALVVSGGLHCGGAPPPASPVAVDHAPAALPPEGAEKAPTKAPTSPAAEGPSRLAPDACADPTSAWCTPPEEMVERLCKRPHQDAALLLFGPKTPFSRVYARGRVDELRSGEELLVLRFHAPQKGGMVVGTNGGTFDLLRWDGTCSNAIESEIVTRSRPGHPSWAHLQWHRVSPSLQDALVARSDSVRLAHARRGKECRGAMSGDVSAACEKADGALVGAIVDFVRGGGSLPDLPDGAF